MAPKGYLRYFIHHPGFARKVSSTKLLKELEPLVADNVIYGITTLRKSCKFAGSTTIPSTGLISSYGNNAVYKWSKSPTISKIRDMLQEHLGGEPFDYCLAHIYPDGRAAIAWHADKEAANSIVASVSFGATRKFLVRRNRAGTKGPIRRMDLAHGDLVVMRKGCQSKYIHSVPREPKITTPRVNLTFRYFPPG